MRLKPAGLWRLGRAVALACGIAVAAVGTGCAPLPADSLVAGPVPAEHRLSDAFWRRAPDCVLVLPATTDATGGAVSPRSVERALATHLSGRVARVIGPDRRTAETRYLALDLHRPEDRARYAELSGCGHGVELSVAGGRSFALVWAGATLSLEASLVDLASGAVLWTARHRASRGDGGLPTSPLGLLVAVGRAGRIATDRNLTASVLADGLRALTASLPDTRTHRTSRNSRVRPLSSRK